MPALNAEQFAARTRAQGGSSARVSSGRGVRKGYMVSDVGYERQVPGEPSAVHVQQYVEDNKEQLAKPSRYLGAWTHAGNTFLDVSRRIMDKPKAVQTGQRQGQLGVYDAERDHSIKVLQAPLQGRNKGTLFSLLPRSERMRVAESNATMVHDRMHAKATMGRQFTEPPRGVGRRPGRGQTTIPGA